MSWKKKFITIATLSSASTLTIHMINKFIDFCASLDNLLDNPSGTYYNWKFGEIYYKKTGHGSPLLLIHDLTVYSSGHEWSKVLSDLSKEHTVYRIDLLGCGRSDKPNLTYTNYLYVQLISDFIKHIIGEQTDIIATGLSGALAVAACHNDNSIIRKVILINPPDVKTLAMVPDRHSKLLLQLINFPIIGTLLYNLLTRREDIENTFKESYFCDCKKIDNNTVSTYYEAAHMGNGSPKHLFSSLSGRYTTVNMEHFMKSLTNSIYMISGEQMDNLSKIKGQYKTLLPSIESTTIAKSKYLPQLEQPDEFIEQVNLFLDDEF
ncbi:MAG: alpha/beta fold hydrolase [Lachnospiraceae bacterium]